MDPERLKRIRNWQSTEFYSRLVMRPLSIAIILVAGDWKILTPNRVTTLANICKVIGAVLVAYDHRSYAISAAVWLQVGTLFDHLDGQLARYRGTGSTFGAFYDKASDAVTWGAICGALGWAAYNDSDPANPWLLIAALGSAYALLVIGYMKWIIATAEAVKLKKAPKASHPPPTRTPAEWAKWIAGSCLRALLFEEIDLFFWIGLGLILDELPLLIWVLAITQAIQLAVMIVKRGLDARSIDHAPDSRAAA
ncbi:MAG: CDP-alcohol phosphatidyltransferase family protein [Kofleriaceae bacterium]